MHDWWLALIASRLGRVVYLDRPCISYRQHSNNVVGAKGYKLLALSLFLELLKGAILENQDMFQGINTTWTRISKGSKIQAILRPIEDVDEIKPRNTKK